MGVRWSTMVVGWGERPTHELAGAAAKGEAEAARGVVSGATALVQAMGGRWHGEAIESRAASLRHTSRRFWLGMAR